MEYHSAVGIPRKVTYRVLIWNGLQDLLLNGEKDMHVSHTHTYVFKALVLKCNEHTVSSIYLK